MHKCVWDGENTYLNIFIKQVLKFAKLFTTEYAATYITSLLSAC